MRPKRPFAPCLALLVAFFPAAWCGAGAAQPAAPEQPEPASLEWPVRAASQVRELEVGPWQVEWVGVFRPPHSEADKADLAAMAEQLGCDAEQVRFEGPGSVLVRMPQGEVSRTAKVAGKPAAAYEYLSASVRPDGKWQLQRTWFALYQPKPGAPSGPRGLVVLLPGMFGTPEPVIDSVVGMLRGRGWHVLRMLSHPSRFTEQAAFMLDPGGDLVGTARAAAAEFGDRAAECALSVDAVCAEIAEHRPDIPVGHRVGLGMSGGGMVLSTVIAHDRDAYTSAVFIGAGCDFAQIAIDSNYTDWIDAVHVSWVEGGRTPDAEARFSTAYRAAATFDSYATAPRLVGLPMLTVQGTVDLAVPSAMGDLLWERLGEPERWSEPLGHETLFLVYLPTKAGEVLDWIDSHTR